MGPPAATGFHVVGPDQRGYGRTTGWDRSYDGDFAPFRLFNLVRDGLGLVAALGYRSVAAVTGHVATPGESLGRAHVGPMKAPRAQINVSSLTRRVSRQFSFAVKG